MKQLHKITRLKTEDGVMSFTALGSNYKENRNYALIPGEQISQILNEDIAFEQGGDNYYIVR